MERRLMNEEFITKSIISFLKNNGWNIFAFDFPQSGTGFLIHPNNRLEKNKDSLIPDIIANKKDICIIMENKSFFYHNDFLKLNELKNTSMYNNDLNRLLTRMKASKIKYGIGIPNKKDIINKSLNNSHLVDFIITVDEFNICKQFVF